MKVDRLERIGGVIAYIVAGVIWLLTITLTGLDELRFTQPQSIAVFAVPVSAIGTALAPTFTSFIRRREARRGDGQVPPPPPG